VFRASVGYRDADSWGIWVVVGNGGAAREVEAAGRQSRQYPCADEERLRWELELIQSIEHNNNCFYTN
jgi:hypothetical protein